MLGSNIAIGTICAVEEKVNLFQRVRVDILTNRDKQGTPHTAVIRSIDEGWTRSVQIYQLYYLPAKLAEHAPQAVDIHLCRLQPRDLDPQWSPAINEMVIKWLHEPVLNEDKQYYLYGKIVLSMGGCLWVDPLECRQHLTTIGIPAIHFSFRSRLLQCNLALENPSHLTKLYELCKEGGLLLPDYNKGTRRRKAPARLPDETLKPDWGFLQSDELNVGRVISVATPSSFFVQCVKFVDLLEDLNNDICNHQSEQSSKAWKNTPTEPGSLIIAKFPGNLTWYRALIEKVEPNGNFMLFFVDFGDRAIVPFTWILPLPDIILSKLPFQAIECSLCDVCPLDNMKWSDSAGDLLDSFVKCDDSTSKPLVIKVTGKTKSTVTGGWRYLVKVFDASSHSELGKKLVALTEAQYEAGICPEVETDEMWKDIESAIQKVQSGTQMLDDKEEYDDDNDAEALVKLPYYEGKSEEENEDTLDASKKQEDPYGFNSNDMDIDSDSDFSDSEVTSIISTFPDKAKKELQEMFSIFKCTSKVDAENSSVDSCVEVIEEVKVKADLTCSKMSPALMKTAYEPSVSWSQNEVWLTLKILLQGVVDYDLYIETRRIKFLTKCDERIYFWDKTLFGFIIPDLCKHSAKGQLIEVKLYKLASFPWLRFEQSLMPISSRSKVVLDSNATHDIEDAALESEDETRNTYCKIGTGGIAPKPGSTVYHDNYNDDNSSDTSDDEVNTMGVFDPFDPLV